MQTKFSTAKQSEHVHTEHAQQQHVEQHTTFEWSGVSLQLQWQLNSLHVLCLKQKQTKGHTDREAGCQSQCEKQTLKQRGKHRYSQRHVSQQVN